MASPGFVSYHTEIPVTNSMITYQFYDSVATLGSEVLAVKNTLMLQKYYRGHNAYYISVYCYYIDFFPHINTNTKHMM